MRLDDLRRALARAPRRWRAGRPGLGDAQDLAGERLAHDGELAQVRGPHLGVGAGVQQDDGRGMHGRTMQIAGRRMPLMRRT